MNALVRMLYVFYQSLNDGDIVIVFIWTFISNFKGGLRKTETDFNISVQVFNVPN